MTEVYINKQQVFFKEGTNLKLNIENQFFEDAGSYTYEVAFPLDIEENRKVFGALNRMDVSKKFLTFDAEIIVSQNVVFKGSAKITGINDNEVKLQLLSGKSLVKFWSKAQKLYIDEFHYEYYDTNHSFDGYVQDDSSYGTPLITAGSFPGKKGVYCYVPTIDEDGSHPVENCYKNLWNEHHLMINVEEQAAIYHGQDPLYMGYYIEINRECINPNLMFVAKWIFNHLGYTVGRNDVDYGLINGIYIANARNTTTFKRHDGYSNSADEMSMAKALPHWTVEEFINQLQNFLNVTFVFDDIKGSVDIIWSSFTDGTVDITDSVEDEYEVDMIDDEDVSANLYDSNVEYKKGESNCHGLDLVESSILKPFNVVYSTGAECSRQWNEMSDFEKKHTIWKTEWGWFCTKVNRNENGNETLELVRFNYFGGIIRNPNNDNNIELKISPVATLAMEMPVFEWNAGGTGTIYRDPFNYRWTCGQTVLSLKNKYQAANKSSVWDAMYGTYEDEIEKEDIMQVFLMDDKAVPSGFYHLTYQIPFTHWDYNRPNDKVNHESWSLALTHACVPTCIGHLHEKTGRQNRNAEYRFRFTADKIPSVYSEFMVRNKKYACKKLEVQFNAEGLDKSILGFFEEIL